MSCLLNLLSQDEIAEIANNPLASDRAKRYVMNYKIPELAKFEMSKLIGADVCDSMFSKFNPEKIIRYYLTIRENNLINMRLFKTLVPE